MVTLRLRYQQVAWPCPSPLSRFLSADRADTEPPCGPALRSGDDTNKPSRKYLEQNRCSRVVAVSFFKIEVKIT